MEISRLYDIGFLSLVETGTSQPAYGGSQSWFAQKKQRARGCGPVAAANILCHLAGGAEGRLPLYPGGAVTQARFLELMEEIYRALPPSFLGVYSCRRFAKRVAGWAQSRDVRLLPHLSGIKTHSREQALEMICQGLERGSPVAALNLKRRYTVPPGGENFGWHWVTVTGLGRSEDGRLWLVASSWGRRYLLDWEGYWLASRKALLPGGFVWFERL